VHFLRPALTIGKGATIDQFNGSITAMTQAPEPPWRVNNAPDLPHFGKAYVYHGPSGILTFRIDMQRHSHDGFVMLSGTVLHGSETYETGLTQDQTGELISVWVTESQYMRLNNGALNQ
jgi:hypothetical protein